MLHRRDFPCCGKIIIQAEISIRKGAHHHGNHQKDRNQKSDRRQLAISITCIVIVAAMLLTSLITLLPIYN